MSQITDQAESLRQQAISLLMAERQTIDQKLSLLGADGTEALAAPRSKACGVCGSAEHNARFHKKGTPESAPIPTA
jgi:hypothetical protein